jgi:predicted Zn-dependent protease
MAAQCRVYFYRLRRLLKYCCLILLLVFIFSSTARGWATGKVVAYVPLKEEIAIGESLYSAIHARGKFIEDPQVLGDLKTISDDILRGVPADDRRFNFKFHIVIDPSVNAYAIPGGHIVVHSGLITHAESAEEIAGVLGHEMGHVVRRHSLSQLVQVAGMWVLVEAALGHDSSMTGKAEELCEGLATLEFSREHEFEADKLGWTFLRQAHIDPHGLESFFERLNREKPHSALLTMLSTHPAADERLHELQELDKAAVNVPYERIAIDFDTLRKRVQEIEAQKK